MDQISDPILTALDSHLLGASQPDSGVKLLDDILNLHFRLYYNISRYETLTHKNSNENIADMSNLVKRLDILLKECEKLQIVCDQSIQLSILSSNKPYLDLVLNILQNCQAIILFYKGDKERSTHYFNKLKHFTSSKGSHYDDFNLLLQLEKFYYSELNALNLNESMDAISALNTLSKYFVESVVPFTKIICKGYIYDYFKSISQILQLRLNQLNTVPETSKLLFLFIFILNNKLELNDLLEFNKVLLDYSKKNKNLLNVKFPTAFQKNNNHLEQFHIILQIHLTKLHSVAVLSTENESNIKKDIGIWKPFIISSMGLTFQSHVVAKTAMIFFHSIEEEFESILNFENIIKFYNSDEAGALHTRIFLIDSYNYLLSIDDKHFDSHKSRNIYSNELFTHLVTLYQNLNLKLFDIGNNVEKNRESLNFISNNTSIVLPNTISDILINSWSTLYDLNSNKIDSLQSFQLTSYLCNAMALFSNHNTITEYKDQLNSLKFEIYYKYAYTLASLREIDSSINFLQSFVLKENPFFYKAWHLLSLCKSIKEDKQDSYKIICSVLESLQNNDNDTNNEIKDKNNKKAWEIINCKITELYLIDEIFGTKESMESLPDLFETFHKVYNNDSKLDKKQNIQLQDIWLLTAELYMKLYEQEKELINNNGDDNDATNSDKNLSDLLKQAKEAIMEAKKLKLNSTDMTCSIIEGYYYMLEGNLTTALNKFEQALDYDKNNVDALVGYSQLILSNDDNQKQNEKFNESIVKLEDYLPLMETKLCDTYQNTQLNKSQLFINKSNQLAAFAYVKLLLERSIINSIDAFYSGDIWWYLSLIYEKYQEREYQNALLTCIRNKETTPIRPFKCLQ